MTQTDLIEGITNCLDKKKYAVGVFIDLIKAFDTIDHDILLNKMERYGIRGVVWKWLKSYEGNRQQSVKIGEYKSICMDAACPVGVSIRPKIHSLFYVISLFEK